MAPRRVIVHAGFHKTGTTSAQRYLLSNGKNIWPRCALVLPGKLRQGAARMAVRYSRFGTKGLLDAFADDLGQVLRSLDLGETRSLLISDENLAGRMPGRDGQKGYSATADLMARLEEVVKDVVAPDADIHFHFTTRAPDPWLRSTYKHNLRTSRLTLDESAYIARFSTAADLSGVAAQVAARVSGKVHTTDLAALADHAEGPAKPLIDLMDLPDHLRKALLPKAPENKGPSNAVIQQLLDLNRSRLSDEALTKAKATLLDDPEDEASDD